MGLSFCQLWQPGCLAYRGVERTGGFLCHAGEEEIRVYVPLSLDQPLELVDGNITVPDDLYITSGGSQYITFPYGESWMVRQGSDGNYQHLYEIDGEGGMTIATNAVSGITVSAGAALKMSAEEVNMDALDANGSPTTINLKQAGDTKFRINADGLSESIAQVETYRLSCWCLIGLRARFWGMYNALTLLPNLPISATDVGVG